jgi:rSAM/selenodomain-associated transferase 2
METLFHVESNAACKTGQYAWRSTVPTAFPMCRISVIIPALNEAEGIAAAIERAWANKPHEVLVVDGGSSDDTQTIAKQCGATLLCGPRGRAVQQNLGAAQATGDVLLFLHADTWLESDGCRQIAESLRDETKLCGAFRQRIDAEGAAFRLLERGNAWRARRLGLPYGDQGLFLRRETFRQLGGFPEVQLMEDWLLMRRLRRIAWPVLLPGPLHVSPRRWQRHGLPRQTARNWLLVAAATMGVSPNRLVKFYPPHKE